jgi:hypothetical protein
MIIFDLNLKVTKFTGLLLLEMICAIKTLILFNDESNTNVIQYRVPLGIVGYLGHKSDAQIVY